MKISTRTLVALSVATLVASAAIGLGTNDAATATKPATRPAGNSAYNDINSGPRELDATLQDDAVFTAATANLNANSLAEQTFALYATQFGPAFTDAYTVDLSAAANQSPIPEPTTLTLLALGTFSLLARRPRAHPIEPHTNAPTKDQ